MTPDDLINELHGLVGAGRFRDAVDPTVRVLPDVRAQMTPEHANRLHEIMHFTDTMADLEESADAEASARAEVEASRPA
jgi:hypothetical protein